MAKTMERSLRITFKPLREIPPASIFFIAGLGSYPALPTADLFLENYRKQKHLHNFVIF
jgi:hypothetical protein